MTVRLVALKPTKRANMRFVDANVLLYAVSDDEQDQAKTVRAKEILLARDLALSVQVLQEFYAQATRNSRRDRITHEWATSFIEALCRFPIQETTVDIVLSAIETSQRFIISYWDGAIIEAARALGCGVVLTEDLSDGQDYAGVKVENPFRDC
jgi:predicted nucleic acid-binding protein